ncbi:hypothetical protein ABI59_08120 [Acidobacteria bacterium Mor1]|nr:hypothetical protein ABI59_08120 [Acidobacteria bacterium Mor1]
MQAEQRTSSRPAAKRTAGLALAGIALAAAVFWAVPATAGDLCEILDIFSHWELTSGKIQVVPDGGCDIGVDVGGGGGPDLEPAWVGSKIDTMPGGLLYEMNLRMDSFHLDSSDRARVFLLTELSDSTIANGDGLVEVFVMRRRMDDRNYLMLSWASDDESGSQQAQVPLNDSGSTLVIEWLCSSSADARDGVIRLTQDDQVIADIETKVHHRSPVEVRFGLTGGGNSPGTVGTLRFRPIKSVWYHEP